MNDYETAPGPDPTAGDYLGEPLECTCEADFDRERIFSCPVHNVPPEEGSSHGLEPVADDYAEALTRPYCAEHDMYEPCHWCPPDPVSGDSHPVDRALDVAPGAAGHLVDFLISDGQARGWIPATGISVHVVGAELVGLPDTPEQALYDFEITVMASLSRNSRRLGYWLRRALDRYDRRMAILEAAQ